MRRLGRVLFSRYAVSAVFIALEVVGIIYIFFRASTYSYLAFTLAMLADILTILIVINMDANPEYKVSWLVIVLVLPIAGAVLFFLFYRRRLSRREVGLLRGSIGELSAYTDLDARDELSGRGDSTACGSAEVLLSQSPMAMVYSGTESTFFSSGEEYFESLLADLRRAERYIFMEYFIVERGTLWDGIHAVLRERAAAGVDVRLVYDDLGCMGKLPHRYERVLLEEGIKCQRFSKLRPIATLAHNNRDHRKICVVDGRVAYTGGVNIADEYANLKQPYGVWRDGGLKIRGNAVEGLLKCFLSTWDFCSHTISDYEGLLATVKASIQPDGGFYIPFGTGPYPIYRRPVGKNIILHTINRADEYLFVTTPYLVLDYDLTEALCNAAARGVDVRIVTPGVADKKAIKIMTKSAYPYLIAAGVKIYEYTPGFIHEKTLVCDDKYALVGTINLDYRSLMHNLECAVWLYDTPTVLSAREGIERTLEQCELISGVRSRLTFAEWAVRCWMKIFAPLM